MKILKKINLYIYLVKNIKRVNLTAKKILVSVFLLKSTIMVSWLSDKDIFVNAALPENVRCIISGPSDCGKTFLL